jgi:hypothetical protein
MALLFMDGFGGGDGAYKWDVSVQNYTPEVSTPRLPGGYSVRLISFSLSKSFTAATKVIVGFGIRTNSNGQVSFHGDAGLTTHITVVRNTTTGVLEIRRGTASGTLLASGTQSLANDQWNYWEVSATIADAGGEVHVRLNGQATDEVSYVGDTKNAGTATTIDRISIPNAGTSTYVSDLYILNDTGPAPNNAFLGDVVVRTLSPGGDGTYSQLLGSDGNSVSNYLLVDEHPYSSTDYVGSAVVGQKDTYAMVDLPAGVATVYGLQVNGMMAKSDASSASARYILRSGGTDYTGPTRALTTTYTGYYDLYETNPATGVFWTPAGVNAVETGMEVQ